MHVLFRSPQLKFLERKEKFGQLTPQQEPVAAEPVTPANIPVLPGPQLCTQPL